MQTLKGSILIFSALIFLTASVFGSTRDAYYSDYEPIDSLGKWYSPIIKKSPGLTSTNTGTFSKETVQILFNEMNTSLRMELNDNVLDYIHHYTTGQKNNFEIALSLGQFYFSMIERKLNEQQLPEELKYLPIALSGMHNQAISPDGGSGIWKLNYYVAIKYGLKINAHIDERKDPEKSTIAALSYLKDLYKEYKSWNTAITAFTYSPGTINTAIIKSKGKQNYWEINKHLRPSEKQLISSFFASVYVANNFVEHDMYPPVIFSKQSKEALNIDGKISITALAEKLKISEQQLRWLNPTFRGKVIYPQAKTGITFYVPDGMSEIAESFSTELIAESEEADKPEKLAKHVSVPKAPVVPANSKKVVYVVKSGDYLGKIAEMHHVGVSSVKRWNYLRSDRIDIGQKITIYMPENAKPVVSSPAPKSQKPKTTVSIPSGPTTYYTVKEGDTLWAIAKNNPGNSIEIIQKLNGVSDSIKPGQRLKILKQ